MNRRLVRVMKVLALVALAGAVGVYVVAELIFNVSSNAVLWAVADSRSGLEVRLRGGIWKPLDETTAAELQSAMVDRNQENGFQWKKLRVRRPSGALGGFLQKVFGAEVNVMTLSPERFEFATSFRPNFDPTTARERLLEQELQFAITSNFREPSGAPMGWVWHEGRQVNKAFPEWSGVFFVKNGMPWFGPKSLVDEVPGVMTEGAQVYPSVMKNHTVFTYVFDAPDRFFDGPRVTYRSLAGMRQNGEIVFVLSGDGGVMNVKEVTDIAHKLSVKHATLMDGGRALQYSVRTEDGPWHFSAFNTRVDFKQPSLQRQESPVFIAVKRRPPAIRAGVVPEGGQ
jgi:Phosphodiester glycosidase